MIETTTSTAVHPRPDLRHPLVEFNSEVARWLSDSGWASGRPLILLLDAESPGHAAGATSADARTAVRELLELGALPMIVALPSRLGDGVPLDVLTDEARFIAAFDELIWPLIHRCAVQGVRGMCLTGRIASLSTDAAGLHDGLDAAAVDSWEGVVVRYLVAFAELVGIPLSHSHSSLRALLAQSEGYATAVPEDVLGHRDSIRQYLRRRDQTLARSLTAGNGQPGPIAPVPAVAGSLLSIDGDSWPAD